MGESSFQLGLGPHSGPLLSCWAAAVFTMERETCCKISCDNPAIIVVKTYTKGGPQFFAFCLTHLFTASDIIDLLAQRTMEGDEDQR